MQIYEITYSLRAGGSVLINAQTEDEAENIFNLMSLKDLFDISDLNKGIQIEETIQI